MTGSTRRLALTAIAAVSVWAAGAVSPTDGAGASVGTTTKLVRIGFPAYDGTLTPYTFTLGYPLVTLIYDTLMWRDEQGVPQPWLARSVTPSDGGRRLTVTLHSGVRWQDGRPLTAADVAFTFQYFAAHYQPRFTPELRDVLDARATGPLTVQIDLRYPSLGFDDQPLADLPILPAHLWRTLPPGRIAPPGLPIGSGPYRLLSAGRTGYVFQANRGYFEGTPRVQEIRVVIVRHEQALYNALTGGQVDMLPISLPASAAAALGATNGIALKTGADYTGTALLLNLRAAPFDRLAARRAVAAALDTQRIAAGVGSAVGAARGYLNPASPWSAGAPLQHFDLSAARSAFTTLKLPLIQVLAPSNNPAQLQAGRLVVLALNQAGASATLVQDTSAELERAIGETGAPPAFEAAIESTPALASDDPDFLASVFGSGPRDAPLNFGGYRSSTFDALAARVASASDPGVRRQAVGAELSLLATDLPAIPLFFSQGTFAYRTAAYDGWVFVKGQGILDKRSFLPGQRTSATGANGPSGAGGGAVPGGSSSGSGISVLDILSIVVVAVVVILAAMAIRGRRTAGRR